MLLNIKADYAQQLEALYREQFMISDLQHKRIEGLLETHKVIKERTDLLEAENIRLRDELAKAEKRAKRAERGRNTWRTISIVEAIALAAVLIR